MSLLYQGPIAARFSSCVTSLLSKLLAWSFGLSKVAHGRLRCLIIERTKQRLMDKRLLSQLLDGAAFPLVMVAVAVSQVKVNPHRKGKLPEAKGVAIEAPIGDPAEQKAKKAKGQ